MATKIFTDKTVLEHALERIRTAYDRFDRVVVSFSGGKDSTAVLNLALMVAKERNKLPLEVIYFDEEAVHPTTIEYVKRVQANPDVILLVLCTLSTPQCLFKTAGLLVLLESRGKTPLGKGYARRGNNNGRGFQNRNGCSRGLRFAIPRLSRHYLRNVGYPYSGICTTI
jgi:hypothetical protein